MELITRQAELAENISRHSEYLQQPGLDRDFALDLIRHGICFVVTEHEVKPFFAPSRFVGYAGNTRHDHGNNKDKDGRETNAAIEAILNAPPTPNEAIETEYEQFCTLVGISIRTAPFGIGRKFWDLR